MIDDEKIESLMRLMAKYGVTELQTEGLNLAMPLAEKPTETPVETSDDDEEALYWSAE